MEFVENSIQDEQMMYRIAITLLPSVGDITAKKLISYCGGIEAVFREKKQNLLKIPGIGKGIVNQIKLPEIMQRAEQEMRFIEKFAIKLLFYTDKSYPERLKQCIDSPVLLYQKGQCDLNAQRIVSIVGTRNATDYGKESTEKLLADLKAFDVLVVSGLAYGIDTCAHESAIENGMYTAAVLGHGLDRIYPALNKKLAGRIIQKGCLLSDFPGGTNPDRENFPKRNRIVAGLSDVVIVVESASRGGALITADIANSYNRDVFAFPGRSGDKYSEGCNFLVKTNRAALIESAADLLYMMGWQEKEVLPARQRKLFIKLADDEKKLVSLLEQEGEMGIDKLCIRSGLSATRTASALLNLEFEGIVRCLPGKIYKLY